MDLLEEIRKVAYELYEKSGCIGGREVENWLAAEKIVTARHARLKQPAASQTVKKVTGTKVKKEAKSPETEPKKTKTASKKTVTRKKIKPVK